MKVCGLYKSSIFVNKSSRINSCDANKKITFTSKPFILPKYGIHLTTEKNWNFIKSEGLRQSPDFLYPEINAVFMIPSIRDVTNWTLGETDFAWKFIERLISKLKGENDKIVVLGVDLNNLPPQSLKVRPAAAAHYKVYLDGVPVTDRDLTRGLGNGLELFYSTPGSEPIRPEYIKYLGSASIDDLIDTMLKCRNTQQTFATFLGKLMNTNA